MLLNPFISIKKINAVIYPQRVYAATTISGKNTTTTGGKNTPTIGGKTQL
jgi:hypothetical protein